MMKKNLLLPLAAATLIGSTFVGENKYDGLEVQKAIEFPLKIKKSKNHLDKSNSLYFPRRELIEIIDPKTDINQMLDEKKYLDISPLLGTAYENNTPIEGAIIIASESKKYGNSENVGKDVSGLDGRFSIQLLEGRTYDLTAKYNGKVRTKKDVVLNWQTEFHFNKDDPDIKVYTDRNLEQAILEAEDGSIISGNIDGMNANFEDLQEGNYGLLLSDGMVFRDDGIKLKNKNLEHKVSLGDLVYVQGTVRKKGTGIGIPNAKLKLRLQHISKEAYSQIIRTDSGGNFTTQVSQEDFNLEISAEGYRKREIVSISPEMLTDLELYKGEVMAGRVLKNDGTPMSSTEVLSLDQFYNISERINTNETGFFKIDTIDSRNFFNPHIEEPFHGTEAIFHPFAVMEGYHQKEVKFNGAYYSTEVGLQSNGQKGLDNLVLHLEENKDSIKISVKNQEGKPIDALVTARLTHLPGKTNSNISSSLKFEIKETTGEDGIVDLNEIPPGVYRVLVNTKGRPVTEKTISVPEEPLVDLVLDEFAKLRGRVEYENGNPVQRANVRLFLPEDTSKVYTSLTDVRGLFSLKLPKEKYSWHIWQGNDQETGTSTIFDGQQSQLFQLIRNPKLEFIVLDQETGLPITDFSYSCNSTNEEGKRRIIYGSPKEITDEGTAKIPISGKGIFTAGVEAEGYISKFLEVYASNKMQIKFLLEREDKKN